VTVSHNEDGTINYPKFKYVLKPGTGDADDITASYDSVTNTITTTIIAGENTDIDQYSKEFRYTVTEVVPEEKEEGITYSENSYEITATVKSKRRRRKRKRIRRYTV